MHRVCPCTGAMLMHQCVGRFTSMLVFVCPYAQVVDVGGGTGFTTLGIVRTIEPTNVTLIDQSPHQLEKAKQKPGLRGVAILEVGFHVKPLRNCTYLRSPAHFRHASNMCTVQQSRWVLHAQQHSCLAPRLHAVRGSLLHAVQGSWLQAAGVHDSRVSCQLLPCTQSIASLVFLMIPQASTCSVGMTQTHMLGRQDSDVHATAPCSPPTLLLVPPYMTSYTIIDTVNIATNFDMAQQWPVPFLPCPCLDALQGDAEDLPFPTDSFDRYVSAGSIEYW